MSEKWATKYIARSSAIASRMLGGEMMIMSAVDSTFFTLNPVASVVWQAADGCTPLSEIVTRNVCHEFEVDPETAYRDVEQFVEELSSYGILLVSEMPFPASATAPTEAA
jgi:Coenzyme PQQ synthesis protein D (PqqD)